MTRPRGPIGVAIAMATLSSLAGSQAAQAQACAATALTQAARLVEFETLMMTVSLRCARAGVDLRAAYDGMVAANAPHFAQAQATIEAVLGGDHGAGYDRYVTQVANRYGGGATNPAHCTMFRTVAVALGNPGDGRELEIVAEAMIAAPQLREAGC
ncbi:MAG: hypothetical protein IH997_02485 [Proteobacteria bacterium]|nr:hypothetical protein [Pseudomonadota bacterium]